MQKSLTTETNLVQFISQYETSGTTPNNGTFINQLT